MHKIFQNTCSRKKEFQIIIQGTNCFGRWSFNLYILSNENDSCHSAQMTSPDNIKSGVTFFRPLFLTYFSSRTDRLSASLNLAGEPQHSTRGEHTQLWAIVPFGD